MSKNVLTEDEKRLRLFEDGIAINKDLPKWRRAEAGMEKTVSPKTYDDGSPFDIQGSTPQEESSDIDSSVSVMPEWVGLYKTPYGIDFDELAKAEIKALTRLLVEKKVKYVMGGYGSFGTTVSNTLTYYDGDTEKFYIGGVKHSSGEPEKKERVFQKTVW